MLGPIDFPQSFSQLQPIRAVSPFKIRQIRDELLTLLLTLPLPLQFSATL